MVQVIFLGKLNVDHFHQDRNRKIYSIGGLLSFVNHSLFFYCLEVQLSRGSNVCYTFWDVTRYIPFLLRYSQPIFFHQGRKVPSFSCSGVFFSTGLDFVPAVGILKVRYWQSSAFSSDIFSVFQLEVLQNHCLDFLLQGLNQKPSIFWTAQLFKKWSWDLRRNIDKPTMPKW